MSPRTQAPQRDGRSRPVVSCWQGLRKGWTSPALLDRESLDLPDDESKAGLPDSSAAEKLGKLADGGLDGDFWPRFFRMLAGATIPPAASLKHQTLIIFDWDDTLLCTSWLRQYEVEASLPAWQLQLRVLGETVRELLELSSSLGQTVIVTNALTSWVDDSAARWMPEVLPVLDRMRVISAREDHEDFCFTVSQWKVRSFLDLREEFDQDISNIVVLGDSSYEMDAADVLAERCPKAMTKTVKFREKPTLCEHLREMRVVLSRFRALVQLQRSARIFLHEKGKTTAKLCPL